MMDDATEREMGQNDVQDASGTFGASRMLAVAAHDLRTPLGAMMATIDLLAQTDLDDRQRSFLNSLKDTSEQMRLLADELLHADQSQFLADRGRRNHNPGEMLRALLGLYQAQSDLQGTLLDDQLDPSLNVMYMGYPLALQRIVGNLLENAIKFTKNGTIKLTADLGCQGDHHTVIVHVRDQGPGMAPHELEALFSPFSQGVAGKDSQQGSGLGLWISSGLANELGGALSAQSERAKGTDMRLELPLFPSVAENPGEAAGSIDPKEYRSMMTGKSVLVLDDNPTSREILSTVLETFGMSVLSAATAEDALDLAEKKQFDVFALDLNLPGSSGSDVALQLRERTANFQCAFIALTAGLKPTAMEKFERANFDGFVAKPFAVKTLFEEVGRVLTIAA